MLKRLFGAGLAALAGVAFAAGASAQTLDKIKSAACSSSAPRPTTSRSASAIRRARSSASSRTSRKEVADKLGVKLEIEPVVSSNRMQFLQQGKIDLMIATMNDKPDRRQVVGIIDPLYYASGVNVLAQQEGGAEDLGAAQGPEGLRHPGRLVQQAGGREIRRRHRRLQGPDRGRVALHAGQLHRLGLRRHRLRRAPRRPKWAGFEMPLADDPRGALGPRREAQERDGPVGQVHGEGARGHGTAPAS